MYRVNQNNQIATNTVVSLFSINSNTFNYFSEDLTGNVEATNSFEFVTTTNPPVTTIVLSPRSEISNGVIVSTNGSIFTFEVSNEYSLPTTTFFRTNGGDLQVFTSPFTFPAGFPPFFLADEFRIKNQR